MELDIRDSGRQGGGHDDGGNNRPIIYQAATKGRRTQVSTSIAYRYDYCAKSATKSTTLVDS